MRATLSASAHRLIGCAALVAALLHVASTSEVIMAGPGRRRSSSWGENGGAVTTTSASFGSSRQEAADLVEHGEGELVESRFARRTTKAAGYTSGDLMAAAACAAG